MLELIEKLNQECRVALFQTVMDPVAVASGKVSALTVAVALSRTRNIQMIIELEALASHALMENLGEPDTNVLNEEQIAESVMRRLPPGGGFLALPMSAELSEAMSRLAEEASSATNESITPVHLLLVLIRNDLSVAETLAQSGLTREVLRKYAE